MLSSKRFELVRFSVKTKIIGTVVSIIFLMGSVATFVTFIRVNDSLFSQYRQDLSQLAHVESDVIHQDLDHVSSVATMVSKLPAIINYLQQASPKPQPEEVVNLLASYNFNNSYSSIYILNNHGQAIVSTDPSFVGQDYSFRSYFSQAKADSAYIDIAIGVTSKTLGYYFSVLIVNPQTNTPLGVLVFKLRPEVVHNNLSTPDIHFVFPFKMHLVHQSGVIVDSPQLDKLYRSLGPLLPSVSNELKAKQTFTDITIAPLDYSQIQLDLPNIGTHKNYLIYDTHDQEKEVVAISKISNSPLYIMLEADTRDIEKHTVSVALSIIVLVATTAALAVLLIVLVLGRVLAPIKIINDVSRQILSGDLSQRVNIKTGDELEQLADSFNQVANKLIDTNRSIQQEVELKTTDLKRLNRFMINRELKMIDLKRRIRQLEEKNDH